MRVYYCSSCGKRVPMEDIEDNKAVEVDGLMYCSQCAEEAVPVAEAVEVEPVTEGPLYCDRCNALINQADIQSGKAVTAGGQSFCAQCTAMYLPLLEALKAKQEKEEEPFQHHRRRTPAYGMRAVTSERSTEPHAPMFEKKSSTLPLIGIVAGVVIIIIIIAVAMSGGPTSTPIERKPPDRISDGLPPAPGPSPLPVTPRDTPRFTEDPRAKKAIEAADSFAAKNPNSYDAIIGQYERIEKSFSLSSSQMGHVQRAIGNTKMRRQSIAEIERDKLLREAEELEGKGDISGAVAVLRKFPVNLKSAENCWSRLQEKIDKLQNDLKAKEPYEALATEIEELKKQQKEEEAIEKLKKFKNEYGGSSFSLKAETQIAQLEDILDKRKEEKDRLKREKEEKLAAELETMKTSDPLYYTDFTNKELKANITIRYKDCEHPWNAGPGSYALAVRKPNASMSFEFTLLEKPIHAQLDIAHIISTQKEGAGHLTLTIELNGKPLEKDRRFVSGEAPLALDYDVADKLVKGKNKLAIKQTAGNVGWVVEKIEIRGSYEGDGWKKEKKEADASEKTAMSDYKKWLSDMEKEKEKEAKKLVRKFERGALPALKPGTYDLLKSKSLKGWKMWGEGTKWKFENGELVCQNNVLGKNSSILTTHYKNMYEWQDYELVLKFKFENSSENTVFMRMAYPTDEKSVPGPCLACGTKAEGFPLGKEIEFKISIDGDKANVFVDGKQTTKDHQIAPYLKKGFPGIVLGQNATVHIKEAKLILKR